MLAATDDAVKGYVEHYNDIRLNSAIGYITPKDMVAGHHQEIQADRGSEIGGGEGTAEESPPGKPPDGRSGLLPVGRPTRN
jgi:hypothetical protein